MSKGSKQRPTNKDNYNANWEKIFGVKNSKEDKKSLKEEPLKKDK